MALLICSQQAFIKIFHDIFTSAFMMLISVNDNIVDIEEIDAVCSPAFVVDGFGNLFLH